MPTDKQVSASRKNGARSRGPVTPQGKRNSARKISPYSGLARSVVLEGESRVRFDALIVKLTQSLKPQSDLDHLLIGKMATSHWRQIRLWESETAGQSAQPDLEMRLDRQFFRTLNHYMRLHPEAVKNVSETLNPASL